MAYDMVFDEKIKKRIFIKPQVRGAIGPPLGKTRQGKTRQDTDKTKTR